MERRAYRSLLLHIAQKLTVENRRYLVFLYELPERWKERDACDILDELGHRNKFSCTNLDGLVTALEELNREDLVSIVKVKMEEQNMKTKQKQDQQVLNLKRQMEMALKSTETLRLTMENIQATIGGMKEDHLLPTDVQKSVEAMMGTAHDKNKESLVMLKMASQHLGFKPSKISETTLVVGNGLPPVDSFHEQPILEEPSTIHKTPPRSPTSE